MPDRSNILTLVIPVFNRADIIMRTLDSVAAQTAADRVEIIIVDNNSSDNSVAVVRKWIDDNPSLNVKTAVQKKKGATAARNLGLAMTETPWVMFFDSDDVMNPGHIDTILEAIRNNPDAELIGWEVDQQLPSRKRNIGRFTTSNPLENHLIHAILATLRYAVRTDLIRVVGGWNEDVDGWDDYELGVRLLLKKPKMVKIEAEDPNVIIYFTDESITGNNFSGNPPKWEHALDLIESYLAKEAPEYLHWIEYRRAILAADYRREGDKANACRLLAEACGKHSLRPRIIYLHHLILHRGAYLTERMLHKVCGTISSKK